MNIDLPNLTSIISEEWYCFRYPRVVTLKSIFDY